jgi:uncharacterized protein (DUF1697 family)
MPTIISLLRGINVGGHKKIKMADLRDLYAELGFENTKTLLQSGNAVFQTDMSDLAKIQDRIETGIQEHFGFQVDVILRTPEDIQAILSDHPFSDEQISDPGKISFVYLASEPSEASIDDLKFHNMGDEIIHGKGRELYIFYTDGKGKSKLDNSRIERALEIKATARNWNTTQKIMKLVEEFSE